MNGARWRSGIALSCALAIMVACSPGAQDETAPTTGPVESSPSAGGPRFPDETTTGVPDGVVLKPSGSLRITKNGTVVDGLEVRGTITVQADNVIIRNTRVLNTGTFAIRVDGGRNLLVEDSEIDGQGRGDAAVAFSRYTLRRVHIYNVTEGPRIAGSDVTIEDSYIHQLVQRPGDHTDAVQMVSGKNALIRGNRIDSYNPAAGSLGNAAFMFGEDMGKVTNCRVEGNYFNGGNYTINGGGAGTKGAGCTFRDNALGRDHRYGPAANLGPNVNWDASNTWADTGDPVRTD